MNKLARLPAQDRRDIFSEAAAQIGIRPTIIEKDFWVCVVLKLLFLKSRFGKSLVFKGGTSLSKAHGLIERFSEDIDLVLDWKVIGFGMILFVGAIQAIPVEVNEAALVDGASFWQRLGSITLPLTLRTVLLVTLISVIGSLLAFDQFYIMTAGQPQNLTATSVFYVYLNAFPYLKLGYGAALSLILAAFVLLFTLLQMVLTRRSHA